MGPAKPQHYLVHFDEGPHGGFLHCGTIACDCHSTEENMVQVVRGVNNGVDYIRKTVMANDDRKLWFDGFGPTEARWGRLPTEFFPEILCWTDLSNVNLRRQHWRKWSIVLKYYNGGNLWQVLQQAKSVWRGPGLPEWFVWHVVAKLARAIAYLLLGYRDNEPLPANWDPIMQRDLATRNVFIHWPDDGPNDNPYPQIILGDFGLASRLSDRVWPDGLATYKRSHALAAEGTAEDEDDPVDIHAVHEDIQGFGRLCADLTGMMREEPENEAEAADGAGEEAGDDDVAEDENEAGNEAEDEDEPGNESEGNEPGNDEPEDESEGGEHEDESDNGSPNGSAEEAGSESEDEGVELGGPWTYSDELTQLVQTLYLPWQDLPGPGYPDGHYLIETVIPMADRNLRRLEQTEDDDAPPPPTAMETHSWKELRPIVNDKLCWVTRPLDLFGDWEKSVVDEDVTKYKILKPWKLLKVEMDIIDLRQPVWATDFQQRRKHVTPWLPDDGDGPLEALEENIADGQPIRVVDSKIIQGNWIRYLTQHQGEEEARWLTHRDFPGNKRKLVHAFHQAYPNERRGRQESIDALE